MLAETARKTGKIHLLPGMDGYVDPFSPSNGENAIEAPADGYEDGLTWLDEMKDTVRAALWDPPVGAWTDEDLVVFDKALRDACSGELTMQFQRMHVTLLIELRDKIRDGRIQPTPRIDWRRWRGRWGWDWPSAKWSLAEAWDAVKPQGLRDLEFAAALEAMAVLIESLDAPTDWQKLLLPPGSPDQNLFTRLEEGGNAVAELVAAEEFYRYYDRARLVTEGDEIVEPSRFKDPAPSPRKILFNSRISV